MDRYLWGSLSAKSILSDCPDVSFKFFKRNNFHKHYGFKNIIIEATKQNAF